MICAYKLCVRQGRAYVVYVSAMSSAVRPKQSWHAEDLRQGFLSITEMYQ